MTSVDREGVSSWTAPGHIDAGAVRQRMAAWATTSDSLYYTNHCLVARASAPPARA